MHRLPEVGVATAVHLLHSTDLLGFADRFSLLAGRPLDVTVAAQPLSAGEVALSIPEHLVVTLDRIFESQSLAEMLTAGKLSELACLTLYMMYEKKVCNVSTIMPERLSAKTRRLRATPDIIAVLISIAACSPAPG